MRCDHRFDRGLVGHVGRTQQRPPATGADGAGQFLGRLGIGQVIDRHVGPGLRQRQRHCLADPRRCPRHQSYLAVQLRHVRSPCRACRDTVEEQSRTLFRVAKARFPGRTPPMHGRNDFLSAAALPPWLWPRAGYVHVPFCAHHCGYCDFAVATGRDHLIDRYLDALAAELSTLQTPQPVRTLFLGGGTPTHLDAGQLERLLGLHSPLAAPGSRRRSSPSRPTPIRSRPTRSRVLADHGVNRVSLGAQSFHPHLLAVLERATDPDHVRQAVGAHPRAHPARCRSTSSSACPASAPRSGGAIWHAPSRCGPITSPPTA